LMEQLENECPTVFDPQYTPLIRSIGHELVQIQRDGLSQRRLWNLVAAIRSLRGRQRDPFRWDFAVVRSPSINAFALPGGIVRVTSGLLRELNPTRGELAALLGHEMGHVLHRHSMAKILKQLVLADVLEAVVGGFFSGATTANTQSSIVVRERSRKRAAAVGPVAGEPNVLEAGRVPGRRCGVGAAAGERRVQSPLGHFPFEQAGRGGAAAPRRGGGDEQCRRGVVRNNRHFVVVAGESRAPLRGGRRRIRPRLTASRPFRRSGMSFPAKSANGSRSVTDPDSEMRAAVAKMLPGWTGR
jgi:Peptidase family M48